MNLVNNSILIKCLDAQMNVVGYVDEFRSLTWGYSWSNVGNWTIILDRTAKHSIDVLRASQFIQIANIPSSITVNGAQMVYGVIDKVVSQYRPSGDTVTITGYELKALARRRIIRTAETYTDKASEVMTHLLRSQMVFAADDERKVFGNVFNQSNSAETTDAPEQYTNLADNLINIAEAAELGWHAQIGDDGGIYWYVIDGVDRTANQHERSPMLLDFTSETIDEATYEVNLDTKNFAYIGGKGNGANRKFKTAVLPDEEVVGFHRHEIFVDARNEEEANLAGKGTEALNEYSGKTTIKIVPSLTFLQRFGTTYNLGDIGTFTELNNLNMRFTGAELNFENNNIKGNFTFGYDKKTIKSAMNILLRSYRNMLNQ
ncbi:MAG: siphovirus ReqiPepy6 Gp37-like family protein [Paludibacteraceae bacterium]|nr:siphovirus ReqiPepy6 Gp37-like family protein [Paludibacteraceae bacterium]